MGEEKADNTNHQEALSGNLSVTQPGDREKQGENEPVDLGYDPGPREAEFQRKPKKVPEKLDNINIKSVSERKIRNESQPLQWKEKLRE